MTTSKIIIETGECGKLPSIILNEENNIADNLVLFGEQPSRRKISYSYIVDTRYPNSKSDYVLSNEVSVKIYKQK